MAFQDYFEKDYKRPIETVIKADDRDHILQEVEEYVITKEISQKLGDFFDQYNNYEGANGVWISGFFGSGKSHLLKILSYVLEDKTADDKHLGELFADNVQDDAKLRGDIKAATRIPSESILFNIDQQAQITSKTDANAILQVFYKVFYDHQGFYGFQPHIAEFELWLTKKGKYDDFVRKFKSREGQDWNEARIDYHDPDIEEAVAEICADLFERSPDEYLDILDKMEDRSKFSIEDFAQKVHQYIQSKSKGFRLNFYIDEVGQYIAENTKLMLNLQTLAESLATICKGRSWIMVTSQTDLESLVGDETATQSDDFSKIQGRFRIRIPLTSANVDEVIEKRLLAKNELGRNNFSSVWSAEKDNLATLISFSNQGIQFRNSFRDVDEFMEKYPFIPYQFDLFQQCIKALSRHNAFQGKHASVGERSMLGVFQEVLKKLEGFTDRNLVSFDQLFGGLRSTMRSEVQNSIIVAESQLSEHPLAIRILKALFLVKYYDSFKPTIRNISVLLLNDMEVNPNTHQEKIEEKLNLLEQQNYVQRQGEVYEFLTDVERDIQEEIKATEIDATQVTDLFSTLLFDGIIKDSKIKYEGNNQYYGFTKKVDDRLFGREKELIIEIVSPNFDRYEDTNYYQGMSMGNQTHMLLKLAPADRIVRDARLYIQTEKYIKQNQSTSNEDTVKGILIEQAQQNRERKREMIEQLNEMLAQATIFLNGTEHNVSSTGEGKTKVLFAFQDLVKLAYPKLKLLGEVDYTEVRLRSIMLDKQDDLFAGDDQSITAAEHEVLNFIQRRKKMDDRTSLSTIRSQFSAKPYGWNDFATWGILGMLFKRGKIEARESVNPLEDKEFLEAILNNRNHTSTLIYPQVEFDQGQIRKLKQIHSELFNETNPYTEPRDVAACFKEKAAEELDEIQDLIGKRDSYPFVEKLSPLSSRLKDLRNMNYANLILDIGNLEDELCDLKEDVLDPIKQFMNGELRNIYDDLREFEGYNKANFEYISADQEKETLSEIRDNPTPYLGNAMRSAKQAMEELRRQVKIELQSEREKTLEEIDDRMTKLRNRKEFGAVEDRDQVMLLSKLKQERSRANEERFIGNLRDQRRRLSDIYTELLNQMVELTTVENDKDQEARRTFIKQKNIRTNFTKKELESEDDVNEYLQALRESMLKYIQDNHNIILD